MEPTIRLPAKDRAPVRLANRHALRAATQKMHRLSETRWSDVFEQPQGILRFLAAMRDLHLTFGLPAARQIGTSEALALERTRLRALDADLGAHPAAAPAPRAMGRDAAWGALYALNGSALGATSLLRPGAALAHQPSAYLERMRDYASCGALGAFIRALNAQTLDLARATAGADAVFHAMSAHTRPQQVSL